MEDLFEQVRTKKHTLKPHALEILFTSVDELSLAVKAIKNNKPEPNMAAALEKLHRTGSKRQMPSTLATEKSSPVKESIPHAYDTEPIEAIKVDVAVLDRLMNLTEELLVEKMRLSEIVKSFETNIAQEKQRKSEVLNLKSSSESFNRLLTDLQFNVTQARMVPLGQIFERFPRMVRDLAKEHKKEITFEMEGQEIELDRTIIDRLGEPLIHLLRNAVDHGIPASARATAGRQSKGNIILSAARERDRVLIRVENNGNQINWQNIIHVASRRGIINAQQEGQLSRELTHATGSVSKELEGLLYHPQLSTKEQVTETSGRGVGLGIVKSVIEGLGGTVSLESPSKNGGVAFVLSLPLTLAIIQALLVRASNQIFALPFSQIDRSVRVPIGNIKKAFDQEVAVIEQEDIPMVRLDTLFGMKKEEGLLKSDEALQTAGYKLQAELMVITKGKEETGTSSETSIKTGLVIDELIAEQDIVVKPFKGVLKQSKGFAGITLLGDGRPALILDIATLV
jgi:two-component system, chemotaxis family, sensor kinase CheA